MRRIVLPATILVIAAAIAAGCGQFGKVYTGDRASSSSNAKGGKKTAISKQPFDAAAAKQAGCGKIEELKNYGRSHVDTDVTYETNPPASGNHSPTPLDWGIYPTEQGTEHWVHNLEHGHIVIAYKGISQADVDELVKTVRRDDFHIVVLPRKANKEKGVWYVAWRYRLFCKHPSAPALQEMVNEHRDQGPELYTNDPRMKMPDAKK